MKLITNTFVLVAPDSKAEAGLVPAIRAPAARLQHELLTKQPYKLTHEDLIFEIHLVMQDVAKKPSKARLAKLRAELFSKSHACMRASPLPKKYGWGVHYDAEGKLAIYGVETADYQRFADGKVKGVKLVAALRSQRE